MASISRRLVLLSRRCPPKEAAIPGAPASDPIEEAINPDVTPQKSTGGEALRQLVEDLKALDPEIIEDAIRKGKEGVSWLNNEETKEMIDDDWVIPEEDTRKVGFWGEGEPTLGKDEDYYGDDVTSLGHGELEQHRELREYARLIAWELPLLNPTHRRNPFRFRYTSYLGESHPATNKVVVEFSSSDLSLNSTQRDKLIKLAGVRYNPSTDIIKMSCESFDTQAQNKRFLGESITNLIKEAKDGKDTFADVPFDFRHHKPKVRHQFPKEWILTPEKKQYLENKRKQMLQLDDQKAGNGEIVDGKNIVANSLPAAMAEPVPVMAGGPRGRALR
ncbi:37S ribosomal protein S24, mitochondrial [Didymosphaeria variabile]|uniref:37S ribosomal protein S24, mitochondrial n=1 Tax=Didymosphaeria variabile TaxID=1932322 RepID=A0A9W9CFH8_9PLEO|nr:37S ribosomal protein S24, mitochondrial [Didymosphaeria variabile]KAJ4359642.1 37S ribosomal protein S24, mitochondrial [Didymosphaeria variabile]